MKYKFNEHVNVTTRVFAKKLAKKFGLEWEDLEDAAVWFFIGASVKNGKQEEFIEELLSYDMSSVEFEKFSEDLLGQDDFKSLHESLERLIKQSQGQVQGKTKKSTKKK